MNLKLLSLVSFIVCACSSDDTNLIGHWHKEEGTDCDYETVDVADSSFTINKYKTNDYGFEISRFDPHDWKKIEISSQGNALVLTEGNQTCKYYRSDLKKCLMADRYQGILIDMELPKVKSAKSFDQVREHFTCGNLYIGKPKQEFNPDMENPDSIFIQVNDVLISIKDVTLYTARLRGLHDPPNNLNLHIDQQVPEDFVNRIICELKIAKVPTLIHAVVRTQDDDIGLIFITRIPLPELIPEY